MLIHGSRGALKNLSDELISIQKQCQALVKKEEVKSYAVKNFITSKDEAEWMANMTISVPDNGKKITFYPDSVVKVQYLMTTPLAEVQKREPPMELYLQQDQLNFKIIDPPSGEGSVVHVQYGIYCRLKGQQIEQVIRNICGPNKFEKLGDSCRFKGDLLGIALLHITGS